MPLRSDFTIHAVQPEFPEKQEVQAPEPSAVPAGRGVQPLVDQDRVLLTQKIEGRLSEEAAKPPEREAAPEPGPVRRVAFLVVHGMGQQVPFETLSMMGQALLTQDDERKKKSSRRSGAAPAHGDPRVNVRRVRLTQEDSAPELSRVEVQFREKGEPAVDAHLYESYWAPLTEGQISFLQTVAFLYMAAWNGIRPAFQRACAWLMRDSWERVPPAVPEPRSGEDGDEKHFDRWMFGRFRDMPIKRWTYWMLAGVVAAASVLLIPAVLVFTPWGVSFLKEYGERLWHDALLWHWLVRASLVVAAIGFLVIAWWVHYFTVEYVGDVAIYVSSYKVSRFQGIRDAIQQAVRAVAHEIYSAGLVDNFHARYDEVVLVGHSLGSVIAYDALNEAINWDEAEHGGARQVVARTTRLITFGSPLDKTAFLFRTQVSSARNLREALAARQQPLILDYGRYRPETFRWINIWSRRDIISGNLDYYDIPEREADDPSNQEFGPRNPVCNCIDPEAKTPLLAHVQYWNNTKLHEELYEAVWARARARVSAGLP